MFKIAFLVFFKTNAFLVSSINIFVNCMEITQIKSFRLSPCISRNKLTFLSVNSFTGKLNYI